MICSPLHLHGCCRRDSTGDCSRSSSRAGSTETHSSESLNVPVAEANSQLIPQESPRTLPISSCKRGTSALPTLGAPSIWRWLEAGPQPGPATPKEQGKHVNRTYRDPVATDRIRFGHRNREGSLMPASPSSPNVAATDEFRPGGWNSRYVVILTILVLIAELGFLTAQYLGADHLLPGCGTGESCGRPAGGSFRQETPARHRSRPGDRRTPRQHCGPEFRGPAHGTCSPGTGSDFPVHVPVDRTGHLPTRIVPMAASVAVTGAGILGSLADLLGAAHRTPRFP